MPSEGDLGFKAQTIIELPVESLALAVLENYAASAAWNRHNWMLGAQNALGRGLSFPRFRGHLRRATLLRTVRCHDGHTQDLHA